MSKKQIRTAIIGAGGIACSVHLPSLKQIPGCALVAVCDIRPERAQTVAQQFGIERTYTLYTQMLENERPDAVFVLTQPDQSFRIALDCLNAGIATFIEKPAGITLYQAQSLAREARVPCQVGFNRRFIPVLEQVRELMKAAGPLTQVDGWFYKHSGADFYGGCASAFECDTVHVIDLVRTLAGGEPLRAAALHARHGDSDVDNAWNALVAFDTGVTGTIHGNYETGGRVHGFALHAKGASAYINLGFGAADCEAKILYGGEPMFSLGAQGSAAPNIVHIASQSDEYYRYYGYYAEDAAFISALQENRPVQCSIHDALKSMQLVELLKHNRL